MPSATISSPDDGPTWKGSTMSKRSSHKAFQESICWPEDSPVKISPWLERVRVWLAHDPDSSMSSCVSLRGSLPPGFCSKTSLDFCAQTEGGTWEPSSGRWGNAGIGGPGACLTLKVSEFPSDAVGCSLSDVLEPRVRRKYYLSRRACAGILSRAKRRGRKLPPSLSRALQSVASRARDHSEATS